MLRQRALELGFDACRFAAATPPEHGDSFRRWLADGCHGTMAYLDRTAAKRLDPAQALEGARTVVLLAVSYGRGGGCEQGGPGQGVVARYARHLDYHDVLRPRLELLVQALHEQTGAEARSLAFCDASPVLERDLAQRAGLGFAGKHTNLIGRDLGNWFLLAGILTSAVIEPDAGERNRCGQCTRCLSACPTGAITAPFRLDARRCISYLTIELKGSIPEELRADIGTRVFGCDDCLAACPWNRFAGEGRIMREVERPDLGLLGLEDLLGLDDAEFKRRFAGTPMLRAKRRGLLRNACVALGNLGDPSAIPALERAARDPEPLVVEHAHWALGRIRGMP